MTDINHLLNKYSKNYVPGEKRSKEYDNMIRQQTTLSDNIHLLHQLNQELPLTLQLNKCDLKIAETLAKTFHGNLKTLCRNCKKEVIYLTFLFYIKKICTNLFPFIGKVCGRMLPHTWTLSGFRKIVFDRGRESSCNSFK